MKLLTRGYAGYGEASAGEVLKTWRPSAFATAVGAAAGAGALGLVGFTIARLDPKAEKHALALATALPAGVAGILAYMLRNAMDKKCLAAPEVQATGTPRERTTMPFLGYGSYGAVATTTPTVGGDGWVSAVRLALQALGYDVDDPSYDFTDASFHEAVTAYQRDHGLRTTGWVDAETSTSLASLTGEPVPTITAAGIGVSGGAEIKPKTNWSMLAAIGLTTAAVGGAIVAIAAKKHKK